MSYFDDASLVMIPSGYKTSKVYSVKPTDGSGDLTFSRSNDTATRVGPDGLIEKVRTNLATYSEQLNNTSGWGFEQVAVTANAVANPIDGAVTADKVYATVTGSSVPILKQTCAATANQTITVSGYFKKVEYDYVVIHGFGLGGTVFNLAAGTKSGDGTITSVGNGWYRCAAVLAMSGDARVFITPSVDGNVGYTSTANSGIYAFGMQFELGDIATDYIATTSAAVSVGPVANVPRLDYLNSSCPRLLLEPQRTNLRTFSEQFSSLSPSNVTITSNDTTSPDGYANADKLTPSGSGFHTIGNTISVTAGQKYTISIFYKYGTHKNIGFYDNNTAGSEITINMETNAFTLGANVDAGGVVPYGNGWYRAYATFTAGSSNMVNYIIFRDNTNNGNYTGNGSYSWFYGWQVELGAYATSYIPTLGAAVTRGADAASKTGISSLIGQTEGTLFVEVNFNGTGFGTDNDFLIYVGNGSNTNSMYIDYYNNLFRFVIFTGSSLTFYDDIATTNGTHKLALAYKSGSYAAYLDGVQIGVDTNATNPPTTSVFSLGGGATGFTSITKNTNQALLFKTRLTNDALAELTSL